MWIGVLDIGVEGIYAEVGRDTRPFSMAKPLLGRFRGIFRFGDDGIEQGEEPSSSRLQQVLPLAFQKLSQGKQVMKFGAAFGGPHPLVIGAALLYFISVIAGSSAWGFPGAHDLSGLGGADVEEVVVDDIPTALSSADAALISGAGIVAAATTVTPDETRIAEDESLVTVPWSPIAPSGSSGRDVVHYTVQETDTLSSIAQVYQVSIQSIAWSNDLVDPDAIRPGDVLRISPVDGVLHIVKSGETISGIAKKFSAQESVILIFNGLSASGVLTAGDEIVIPGGSPPPPPPKPKPASRPSAPRFSTSQVPLGYYIAPTTGRNYGRRHSNNGVDVANSCGTPVYAAASGSITRADGEGWNGGYGDVVEIVHPNGTDTRYAHLSQIVAWSGQVGQGQLIGYIGSTGRSTGCHLHFEVHGARNPLTR